MTFVGHRNGGIIASLIIGLGGVFLQFSMITIGIMMISTFIFSLYPDCDIKSKSSKLVYLLSVPFVYYLFVNQYLFLLGMCLGILITPQISKHRGFTHSLFSMVIISWCWSFIISSLKICDVQSIFSIDSFRIDNIMIASSIGYLTHLILDWRIKLI